MLPTIYEYCPSPTTSLRVHDRLSLFVSTVDDGALAAHRHPAWVMVAHSGGAKSNQISNNFMGQLLTSVLTALMILLRPAKSFSQIRLLAEK